MKKLITKHQTRMELDKQIADFLENGGKIANIERGTSGRESAQGPIKPDNNAFQQPRTERTYIPEVVAAIEERRKTKPAPVKPKNRRPKKKMIYDDFGEPLRWEWVEE